MDMRQTMKNIREVGGQELEWTQPEMLKQHYELRAGDEVVATLSWGSRLRTSAEARSEEGAWTFRRVGFFRQRVEISSPGEEAAVYRPRWTGNGGTLRLADGREFHWGSTNVWHTGWEWKSARGESLLRFKPRRSLKQITRTEGLVAFESSNASVAELPMLAALGWYLILLKKRDGAAAAGGAG